MDKHQLPGLILLFIKEIEEPTSTEQKKVAKLQELSVTEAESASKGKGLGPRRSLSTQISPEHLLLWSPFHCRSGSCGLGESSSRSDCALCGTTGA